MNESQMLKRLAQITAEAEALGPYLEGDLLENKKAKYIKKDGSVSTYATAPVLQYRTGPGKRRSKRIPAGKVDAVKRLLEAGKLRRALMEQHRELAAALALDFKKKRLIPTFPHPGMVNVEAVLAQLGEELAQTGPGALPGSLGTLDARLAEALRADGREILSGVLSALGRETPYGVPDGYREAAVDSLLGYVSYERAYYAPDAGRPTRQSRRKAARGKALRRKRNGAHARTGGAPCACPLDAALGIVDGMTPALRERAQHVAATSGSFAEGAATLKLLAGVALSVSSFRRKTLAAGNRAIAAQECPVLRLLAPHFPAWLLKATTETVPTLYIMGDGTGVPCVRADTEGVKGKGEDGTAGTRELKVGIVGTFRRLDKKGRPVRDPGCESHIVSAKSAKEFGALLRKLAVSRGYGKGFRIQILGDGAEWIENIVRKEFPGSDIVFTVDFFHACEYVQAFVALAGLDAAETKKAYGTARAFLRRYGAATLLRHLRKRFPDLEASSKVAAAKLAYIEKRQENMHYGEYRKQGLYIGSGLVEAACRTDVARRCKQSGMHWRLKNAAAMCALVARFRSNLPAA